MSLDVYLEEYELLGWEAPALYCLDEDYNARSIDKDVWREVLPGREPEWVSLPRIERRQVFWRNITHNLNEMAREAGLYQCLWRPEELDITKASQLIDLLEPGLKELKKHPARFKKFNPENGWGRYEGLVEFVAEYLQACRDYPEALVRACR